jgi:hypothetical protein
MGDSRHKTAAFGYPHERLLIKPKLMLISWFATFWIWFVGRRDKVIASVRGIAFESWQKSEASRYAL